MVFKPMSVEKYSGFGSQNALQQKAGERMKGTTKTGKNNPETAVGKGISDSMENRKKEGSGAPTLQDRFSDTTEPLGILKQKLHLTN